MAHYAFLNQDNIVTEVIVGRNEWEVVDGISDWEAHYGEIRGQRCLRTSYNGNIRGVYAGIGAYYDEAKDIWSETGNFAQLISFHQSAEEWEKALDISSKKDRLSLPTTYFKFANYLAETDKIGAIAAFEKSNASK